MLPVNEKYSLYKELLAAQQDKYGFIESHECDSLLFSGLLGCVQGVDVKIDAACRDEGLWYRRPRAWQSVHGCYNPNHENNREGLIAKLFRMTSYKLLLPEVSWEAIVKENWYKGSTISRDMLIGLAWYAWYNKRLDISEGVIKYAMRHFGVMGKGDPARINIMPSLFATFCWISYKLGGPSRRWARWIPADSGAKVVDFQAHLQVLHILLRRQVAGEISKREVDTLIEHAKRQPNNPLFAAATLDFGKAIRLLGDPKLWPQDRLPRRSDRKEAWVLQRDYGSDWLPSDEFPSKVHSGADLLFCYALATGDLK